MVTAYSKRAQSELLKAYLYIQLDSLQNAETVRDEIIDLTIDLSNYPTKHPPDKFKKDNDGTWSAFEKHHYRITYRIITNQIRIVRMRHTSRTPTIF